MINVWGNPLKFNLNAQKLLGKQTLFSHRMTPSERRTGDSAKSSHLSEHHQSQLDFVNRKDFTLFAC
jgi:hypothetical protein